MGRHSGLAVTLFLACGTSLAHAAAYTFTVKSVNLANAQAVDFYGAQSKRAPHWQSRFAHACPA